MPLPDYRCLGYPYDNQGFPFFAEDDNGELLNPVSPATHDDYLIWLSTYLMSLRLEPRDDQMRWWKDHATSTPEEAIRALGSELGIEDAHDCLSRHAPIDCAEEPTEYDLEWPHNVVPPIDLGYRLLLAQILKLVESPNERTRLLHTFFCIYWDYSIK
jgi:hypothetical protein